MESRPSVVRSLVTVALALLPVAAGCGDDGGPVPVSDVVVTPATATLEPGDTLRLQARALSASGDTLLDRPLVWTSSDTAVVRVDGSGLVTAVAPGHAVVSAEAGGVEGTAAVEVMRIPAASLDVEPEVDTLAVGTVVELTAVVRAADGTVLEDREVEWSTSDEDVATVDAAGSVTARGEGSATITAETDGASGTARIVVLPPGELTIAAVEPDTLRAGGQAIVTGSGFSAEPTVNRVLLDGAELEVLEASPTRLEVRVPEGLCRPPDDLELRVQLGGAAAGQVVPFLPDEAPLELAVGVMELRPGGGTVCVLLPEEGGEVLVGVQSISQVVSSITPVEVRGRAAGGEGSAAARRPSAAAAAPAPGSGAPAAAGGPVSGAVLPAGVTAPRDRHRRAEAALRAAERELWRTVEVRSPASRASGAPAAVPANVSVGDSVAVRVPDFSGGNGCTDFAPLTTVVRKVGERSVWLEDIENPPGGFTDQNYDDLSDLMDEQIYAVDAAFFGEPTDLDENGRIAVVVTKEVNEEEGLLGFVTLADLFPRSTCASSDEGEIYYGKAPDPNGTFGEPYEQTDALLDAPLLIAHELTHIIQFGHRLLIEDADLMSTWMSEGQATLAEEVNGHAFTGREPRTNLGFEVAFNDPLTTDIFWYDNAFVDLALYFGFRARDEKVPGAPAVCTWLATEQGGNDDPCIGNRSVYGTPWSLLRWVTDHFSDEFGGDAALQRALVDTPESGFDNIAAVLDEPFPPLLARWAATLYVDDRIPDPGDPLLTFPSWDLLDVFSNLNPAARLQPRLQPFGDFEETAEVRAASSAYLLLEGDAAGPVALEVTGPEGADLPSIMQVWLVRVR